MLAGQPPFQSASQNEIYRRARSVEYTWPQETKYSNDIPNEAKDLVARLLKVDAEERPDPDQVIGHPFFSMHGGNAIPLVMEEHFTRETPHYLNTKARPRGDVMINGTERLSLRTLAKQCGVGHLSGDTEPQVGVGGDADLSLYKECLAEENAGNSPVVPLPKDMVYTSKFSSISPQSMKTPESSQPSSTNPDIVMQEAVSSSQPPTDKPYNRILPERSRRAPVQSHAATLRAAHASSRVPRANLGSEVVDLTGDKSSSTTTSATLRGRRGLLNELPVRPTLSSSAAGALEGTTLARNPKAPRVKKVHVLDDSQEPSPAEAAKVLQPLSKDHFIDKAYSDPDGKRRDLAARTRARIASNVLKEMAGEPTDVKKDSLELVSAFPRQKSDSPVPGNSATALIGPDEVSECLPNSKPEEVLHQLQRLHRELETSLEALVKGKDDNQMQEIDVKNKSFKHRPVVVKWVDYTNKFGIGYILANGTVGCVFKGDDASFPTCVIVAGAESHLKKRKSSSYPDKHQIVPRKGAPIEFVENCDEVGLKRVLVQPTIYQVKVTGNVADRLGPGRDAYDFEKRKKLCLWDKFGKYMTQTLGKSEDPDLQILAEESDTSISRRNTLAGPFVKFYQRLGNVGIWGFGDGSFQFNFPDHTKLVVSDGGAWLDFYHLPVKAARSLKAGRLLEAGALAERSVLCYPAAVMLAGSYREHDFKDVVRENELDVKTAFVRDVVGLWVNEGGLGRMGREKGIKWEGMMERGGKLVWVTVGAKGGDGRYEMPAAKA